MSYRSLTFRTAVFCRCKSFFQLADPPDAIFATSDKHAHAVIKAGLAQGFRIPEDIKVFGFDNTMYASLSTPTISTISQHGVTLAFRVQNSCFL